MHKQDSAQLPIARTTWLLWLLVCALVPVLFAIVGAAWGKTVRASDPNAALIDHLIWVVALSVPIITPILQWIPLSRLIPRLGLIPWYFCSLFSGIMVFVLTILPDLHKIPRFDLIFLDAVFHLESLPAVHLVNILSLPWTTLLAWVTFSAAITTVIPSILLGKSSGIKWYLFVLAAIFGACSSSILEQFYFILHFHKLPSPSLNGTDWVYRVEAFSYIGVLGAVYGATSAMGLTVLLRMTRFKVGESQSSSKRISFLAMASITLALIAYAPIATYVVGYSGFQSGFPALRKLFTFAPAADTSTGQEILQYSKTAAITPYVYPVISFAPDSKSIIVLNDERYLSRVDLESAKVIGQLGEPIGKYEYYQTAWSPDGHFFALRTSGEEVKTPDIRYTDRRSHFRVYELPDYRLVADYTHQTDDCFDSSIGAIAFENDSKSLWAVCGYNSTAKPDSAMAIQLSIPTLKIEDIHRYGNAGMTKDIVRGLTTTDAGVFAWQGAYRKEDRLFFTNLSNHQTGWALPDLTQPKLAGSLTLQSVGIEQKEAKLLFCGEYSGVSDAAEVETGKQDVNGFCRTLIFNIASGQLVSKIDDANHKRIFTSSELTTDRFHIETSWKDNSKAGVIVVEDKNTGQQLQIIDSLSQRLLGVTPNEQWLVSYAIEKSRLRIYKVNTQY